MRSEKAISALEALQEEAKTPEVMGGKEHLTAWRAKVHGVLAATLGEDSYLVNRFDGVGYSLLVASTLTTQEDYDRRRHEGIRNACGVIDAALYQLRLHVDEDEPSADLRSYDPDLWEHVKQLVQDEDWAKVASQTAIFVEDQIRRWSGEDTLFGKGLMAASFADASDLRLGRRSGEREGWRFLGMGFAQALGNVDRHRIQRRDDARRYAIGVLGLGSLLLTQLRHEHGELIEDILTGTEAG